MAKRQKIIAIHLDGIGSLSANAEAEHERKVAVHDLLADNHFAPAGGIDGPFELRLSHRENRLHFDIRGAKAAKAVEFDLPLSPFRAIIRDYFAVCGSYFEAIKTATPSRIQAIDIGRRSLHDEGAELLAERMAAHADIDFPTARRLFTLLCTFHLR